jgi:peroxiredoxin
MTIRVGDAVPDVTLRDHEDRPWRLHEHRGRPVVLVLHRHLA